MNKKICSTRNLIRIILIFTIVFAIDITNSYANTSSDIILESGIADSYNQWAEEKGEESYFIPRTYSIVSNSEENDDLEKNNIWNSNQDNINSINIKSRIFSGLNRYFFSFGSNEVSKQYNIVEYLKENKNILLDVKNQKRTDSCWAFSATSVLEAYTAMQNSTKYDLYSVMHMDFGTSQSIIEGNEKGINRKVGTSGNYNFAISYWTNGLGAVNKIKNEDSFYDSFSKNNTENMGITELNKNIDIKLDDCIEFPNINKKKNGNTITYSDGTDDISETTVTSIRNNIKEQIEKYGSVTSCTYMSNAESKGYLTNDKLNYYCDTQELPPDHAITIVGWDDDYPATNFNITPTQNGAYIAQNSYGSDWNREGGYFYISYDDVYVETNLMGVTKASQKDYDNLYQYDPLGKSTFGLYDKNAINSDEIYMANVFSREDCINSEKLNSISIQLNGDYDVEVYVNPNVDSVIDNTDWNNLKKIQIKGDTVRKAGYNTIYFDEDVYLLSEKFIVAVKIKIASNSDEIGVAIEYNPQGDINEMNESLKIIKTWYGNATANAGEGFLSLDGISWEDVVGIKASNGDTPYAQTSLCIKAFTTNVNDSDFKVGSIYKVDEDKKYVYNISENTNQTEFKNVLDENGNSGYRIDGIKNNIIVTGSKITLSDGTVYTAIVNGDVNGDGVLNVIDLAALKKYTIGLKTLSNEYKYAADMKKDGQVNIVDLAKMKKQLIGIDN